MDINLFIFPFFILLGFFLSLKDTARNRKIYVITVTAVLILQTSLRSQTVGSDTPNYYFLFYDTMNISWEEISKQVIDRYISRTTDEDAGYLVLQKLIGEFTDSWPLFVFFANLLFFVPLSKLTLRFSPSMIWLVFAYILYVAMFHIISLSGGRQLYAIGMAIMAFIAMMEKKYYWAVFWILLGITLHMTCLLMAIPLILLRLKKYLKQIHLAAMILVPFIILFANPIIVLMGSTIGMDKYSRYGSQEVQGGAWTFVVLLELVSVFSYLAVKKETIIKSHPIACLYSAIPLFTIFGPLIHSNGSMIRISMYFHIYLMIIIPLAVSLYFRKKIQTIIYSALIVILIMLSIRGNALIYHFYWQEPNINLGNTDRIDSTYTQTLSFGQKIYSHLHFAETYKKLNL